MTASPAVDVELLPVFREDDRLIYLHHPDGESIAARWRQVDETPGTIVATVARRVGIEPVVVHSTSWRRRESGLTLSQLVVIEPPSGLGRLSSSVVRPDIARGGLLEPPRHIATAHVVGHAIRHLAWLFRDEPQVRRALVGWDDALAPFRPRLFEELSRLPVGCHRCVDVDEPALVVSP